MKNRENNVRNKKCKDELNLYLINLSHEFTYKKSIYTQVISTCALLTNKQITT
jgi:hypothetical protein